MVLRNDHAEIVNEKIWKEIVSSWCKIEKIVRDNRPICEFTIINTDWFINETNVASTRFSPRDFFASRIGYTVPCRTKIDTVIYSYKCSYKYKYNRVACKPRMLCDSTIWVEDAQRLWPILSNIHINTTDECVKDAKRKNVVLKEVYEKKSLNYYYENYKFIYDNIVCHYICPNIVCEYFGGYIPLYPNTYHVEVYRIVCIYENIYLPESYLAVGLYFSYSTTLGTSRLCRWFKVIGMTIIG